MKRYRNRSDAYLRFNALLAYLAAMFMCVGDVTPPWTGYAAMFLYGLTLLLRPIGYAIVRILITIDPRAGLVLAHLETA